MRLLPILFFLNLFLARSYGQTFSHDSIVIYKNTYVASFFLNDVEKLYHTDTYLIKSQNGKYFINGQQLSEWKIKKLLSAIDAENNSDNSLSKYHIDTNWIKQHPDELVSSYKNKKDFTWNDKQKEYIYDKLTNIENYNKALAEYLSDGSSYTMHNSYKYEYIVKQFSNGKTTSEIKSRKYVWGYVMPWTNQFGESIYNYNIELAISEILNTKEKKKYPPDGKSLQNLLVSKIIENNQSELYQLSPYSYLKEIEELKSDFDILSFNEVQGRGRYIWNESSVMRIRLKNKYMLDNVTLVFMASTQEKTLYPRDSIKKDYKNYIERIQSINFITNYLRTSPTAKLDLYYFNNKGINDYNIDNVNKNPKSWERSDKWVDILKITEKNGIKSSFDVNEAIKTSTRNNCGCNYRFNNEYISKAIFFEINDGHNSSIWFLLPDNKVLLYIMDSENAVNFKRADFDTTKNYGLIYPCALFDLNGNRLSK